VWENAGTAQPSLNLGTKLKLPDRSTPAERVPRTQWVGGWKHPIASLDWVGKRKTSGPTGNPTSIPRSPILSLVAILTELFEFLDTWRNIVNRRCRCYRVWQWPQLAASWPWSTVTYAKGAQHHSRLWGGCGEPTGNVGSIPGPPKSRRREPDVSKISQWTGHPANNSFSNW
jgi:hypothetical protein